MQEVDQELHKEEQDMQVEEQMEKDIRQPIMVQQQEQEVMENLE